MVPQVTCSSFANLETWLAFRSANIEPTKRLFRWDGGRGGAAATRRGGGRAVRAGTAGAVLPGLQRPAQLPGLLLRSDPGRARRVRVMAGARRGDGHGLRR